jgi:hypothetical protein
MTELERLDGLLRRDPQRAKVKILKHLDGDLVTRNETPDILEGLGGGGRGGARRGGDGGHDLFPVYRPGLSRYDPPSSRLTVSRRTSMTNGLVMTGDRVALMNSS